jgi:DNA-binding response OmpR family regulator
VERPADPGPPARRRTDPPAAAPDAPAPIPVPLEPRGADDLLDDHTLEELERLARARATRPEPSRPAPAPRTVRLPVVLVVDESATVRADVARAFGSGARVIEAADGPAGLRAAVSDRPDLVYAGAAMKRLNGIGFARVLREAGANVPLVLVMSRHARPSERARGLIAGADDVLPQPIHLDDVRLQAKELLRRVAPGSASWPALDPEQEQSRLLPRRVPAEELDAHLDGLAVLARESDMPLCLVGYGFRFIEGGERRLFIDHFLAALEESVRFEDSLCRLADDRIVAALVDADEEGARAVVQRVHERMAEEARGFAGEQAVKPKVLYRRLVIQPALLADERLEASLVAQLFRENARLIEEDLGDRPGAPVEKYPLLESVFTSLTEERGTCRSPLDGSTRPVQSVANTGVRFVEIEGHRYATQDPADETPAGFRAARGARIVWVTRLDEPTKRLARVEDGRVFRGREA